MKNNLFLEFENSIQSNPNLPSKTFENGSLTNILNNSIATVIDDIVNDLIKTNPFLLSSKNIENIAHTSKKFFKDTNFGTFEYIQKTGMNIFKVEHASGINGTQFLKKFFEKMFEVSLKGYSFYIISNESYVCVMFR